MMNSNNIFRLLDQNIYYHIRDFIYKEVLFEVRCQILMNINLMIYTVVNDLEDQAYINQYIYMKVYKKNPN